MAACFIVRGAPPKMDHAATRPDDINPLHADHRANLRQTFSGTLAIMTEQWALWATRLATLPKITRPMPLNP